MQESCENTKLETIAYGQQISNVNKNQTNRNQKSKTSWDKEPSKMPEFIACVLVYWLSTALKSSLYPQWVCLKKSYFSSVRGYQLGNASGLGMGCMSTSLSAGNPSSADLGRPYTSCHSLCELHMCICSAVFRWPYALGVFCPFWLLCPLSPLLWGSLNPEGRD